MSEFLEVGYFYHLSPHCIGCSVCASDIEHEVRTSVGAAMLENPAANRVAKALVRVTCAGRPCRLKTEGILVDGSGQFVEEIVPIDDAHLNDAA